MSKDDDQQSSTSKRRRRSSSRSRRRRSSSSSSSNGAGGHRHRRRRSSSSRRRRSSSRSKISTLVSAPSGGSGGGGTVLEACWKPVRADPTNFDAWTHLLQCVENMDDLNSAREAFDPFLAKFPYCFGYWRKYAEMCRKHSLEEDAVQVYERGVNAVPLSVDLWLGYLAFYKEYAKTMLESKSKIEKLYERSLDACGLEFRSDKLWEDYVNWRISIDDFSGALKIYDRLIKVPLLLYSAHFDRLQVFVNSYEPHEILSQEEFDKYYSEIELKLTEKGLEIFVVDESETNDDVIDEKSVHYKKKYSDEALKLFRIAILDKRRKIHLKTEQEVSKRWSYEEAIKRPYFHVKPLERSQLKNWRHYLDFEIEQNDKKRIKILFERCLVACAMYEDIWLRYARYMENVDVGETRDIFKRACEIHLSHKASLHLSWAAFEEKQTNYEFARAILAKFDSDNHQPGSVLVQTRRLGLEFRRCWQLAKSSSSNGHDQAEKDDREANFDDLCRKYENLIADSTSKMASFYSIKYARFCCKIKNDREKAEKIIKKALERDPANAQLHMNLVQMAYERQPFRLKDVLAACQNALDAPDLTDLEKLQFSQRKLELLEDLCPNVEDIQKHYESHVKLYKNLGFTSGKKRPQAPLAADDKRPRSDAPPPTIVPAPVYQVAAAAATPAGAGYYNYYYGAAAAGGAVVAAQTPQTYGYYVPAAAAASQPPTQ